MREFESPLLCSKIDIFGFYFFFLGVLGTRNFLFQEPGLFLSKGERRHGNMLKSVRMVLGGKQETPG